jgi:hypothetical protein
MQEIDNMMRMEIINQVGLEVAKATGEPYGCKVTVFEVQRYEGNALCFSITLVGDHKAGIASGKIPLPLADSLTGANDFQARLELANILQKPLKSFVGS